MCPGGLALCALGGEVLCTLGACPEVACPGYIHSRKEPSAARSKPIPASSAFIASSANFHCITFLCFQKTVVDE